MDIYFDNSATTQMDYKVVEAMNDMNNNLYANPSAMHRLGFIVEEEVKKANRIIANELNADENEIIWTSGGSESNNLAIKGYVYAHRKSGNHIITTKIEHASVYQVFESLKAEGFDVTYLDVDSTGHIDIKLLEESIRNDTLLVSIMYVNNEIGVVQNIQEIGKVIKKVNPNTAFHTDCVQAFGKYRIDVKKSNIDMLSISSHKIYGPKGVGILYKNKSIRINPLILGGGQQNNMRAGTLNTTGIIGTKIATSVIYDDFDNENEKLRKIRDYTINGLRKLNEKHNNICINTLDNDTFAPHIVSVSFVGIRAEVMLHSLEEKNIYVSAGSACSSHDKKTSSTLLNIGLKSNMAESTIRLSFGKYNNTSEVDEFLKVMDELIPKLKKYSAY